MHEPERILLVRLDHAGEIVLTVPPAVRSLRVSHPDARVEVLTTKVGAELLQDDPHIDELIVFDAPWSKPPPNGVSWRRLRALWLCVRFVRETAARAKRFDVVIYLSLSPWERTITRRWASKRFGFSGPYRRLAFRLSGWLLTSSLPFRTDHHVADNCLSLVHSAVGLSDLVGRFELTLSDVRRIQGQRYLRGFLRDDAPVVAIHAGSRKSMKAWSLEHFLEVARRLRAEFDVRVLFLGTKDETSQQSVECRNHGWQAPLFLTTRSFAELAEVAANVDLFIGNDGGPIHVASLLGTPTVAVFGPTDERVFGPRGPLARVARERGICGANHYPWRIPHCCSETDRECLRLIRPETVYHEAATMLRSQLPRVQTRAVAGRVN